MKIVTYLLSFLKSKWFLWNIIIASIVISTSVYGVLAYLDGYTQHDVKLTVPNFSGYKLENLDEVFSENKLKYKIIDSLYDPTKEKGVVIDQFPVQKSEVKAFRTIYLTINAELPPMVKMPNLINMSKRQAMSVLDIIGLRLKSFEYRPDICTDCVLMQKLDEEEILPGDLIYKGERLTLVLGEGRGNKRINLPYLKGLTYIESKKLLKTYSLELGVGIYEDCENAEDSLKAQVYNQVPEYIVNGRISMGSEIDIWLSPDVTKQE
ncbi:MAG: beta-lactam-binding protein with PASTA domain [Flavobacteriales bacterium]|jgi:beta-lactam-binding protein with PASTA domain